MENQPNPSPKSKSNRLVWIIAGVVALGAVLLCCVLVVAGFLFFQIQKKSSEPQPVLVPTETSAPAGLDLSATPLFGSTSLQRGFSPDPFLADATSGGDMDTSSLSQDCGYTTSAPSYVLNLSGGASATFLRIFFKSDETDPTLLVYTPEKLWKCAETETSASLNGPVLDLENAPSGKYVIWVGSTSGNSTSGQIGISQSESNGP
jgi:hypothetical protein